MVNLSGFESIEIGLLELISFPSVENDRAKSLIEWVSWVFLPISSVKACKWKTGLSLDQQEYLNERLKYDILMFKTNKFASILELSPYFQLYC